MAGGTGVVCRGSSAPGTTGDVRGVRVKEILAIMEVEDGEMANGILVILDWQVDGDDAVIWQDGGVHAEGEQAGNDAIWIGGGLKHREGRLVWLLGRGLLVSGCGVETAEDGGQARWHVTDQKGYDAPLR